ncbi:MAG: hypothetical protein ACOX44_14030 [Limnochordia bacterium]|jgi:hypothetical protein
MQKIKDRVVLGVVAGLSANLIKQTIEWAAYNQKISLEVGADKAAGFLLPHYMIRTKMGRCIGLAADSTIAACLGMFGAYFLTFTGKDHPLLKGLCIGNATWTIVYGILTRMGVSSSVYRDKNTTAVAWLSHTAFGISKFFLLSKLGDPSLFGKPVWLQPRSTRSSR